jgi:hypothetical protein
MRRKFNRNTELCPECGHVITPKSWNCQFCGCDLDNAKSHTSSVDPWNDYPDINNIPYVDTDIDQLTNFF